MAKFIYNATGPTPVTNREFMAALRKALGRPWSPPAPSLMVKLGAVLVLGADPSLALTGRRCLPIRAESLGFRFRHTDLQATLNQLLGKG